MSPATRAGRGCAGRWKSLIRTAGPWWKLFTRYPPSADRVVYTEHPRYLVHPAKDVPPLLSHSGKLPLGGAPHIHGELLKLGIDIGESSVSKYMVRCRKPPSQTWRTFLENHAQQLVSIDFFTVPTIRFQVLYVFLVLAHDRRRIVHCNVTAHPSAEWTGQQLREAFPFDQLPRYLLRDRDAIFGDDFRGQVQD